jgi:pimeloyl-ACP methyl ester carboxylesterase
MPRIEIDGVSLAYELIGEGSKAITITPGGRFSKDTPGVRELAESLAGHGYKVLIWDRPNCGESDIAFAGECETFQNADTLAGLIRALGLGKPLVYGASGGSREALVTAIRHPDCVSGVVCQWLSGGAVGIATLPIAYCASPIIAAQIGGMEAVVELPDWKEQLSRNPANRDRLLAWDRDAFVRKMHEWAAFFFPQPGLPIPCVSPGELEAIGVPVVILRSGASDPHHTRTTSEQVAALIPGADLQEPPWGDREWIERLDQDMREKTGLFRSMPMLVPQITAFARSYGHV